jgi:uncharacterized membrane protein
MKKTKILYWTFTGLFAFIMFGSAIPDVLCSEVAIKGMHTDLGYPLYLIPFIGVAKLLGVIAITSDCEKTSQSSNKYIKKFVRKTGVLYI